MSSSGAGFFDHRIIHVSVTSVGSAAVHMDIGSHGHGKEDADELHCKGNDVGTG